MAETELARPTLTGKERFFGEDEVIVTKTDTGGRITYANQVFLRMCQMTEQQVLGKPHNLIRHPDMPRCVFKLLWDTIQQGREIFAYVLNRAASGDHYWVFAHVTPTYDNSGAITGYHSNRRVPDPKVVSEVIAPLYKTLLEEEGRHDSRAKGMNAAIGRLTDVLNAKGLDYERFIFSLQA
ncbi:PAS domain-containing protein [Azospirillum sp. SYSU D00513]|uniref:PAS domain-containing protein n=1 Tax=Azospirillum sp. SYSU D00513 TaxID=2812561 RepID=UPI001A9675EA|nr:PAS domain-containing protein [Azospirillum sp. SYSU D00513]